ncbi:MAG: family 16 glycoside hydrolase [Bacteroidota bacterium]|nr:family 16 glycoside hydrolase [Bacteroidota bacterium]
METKVADILAQMPTHDYAHRDRLMLEMISLGETGLNQFTGMVVAPGTGDDTHVRFALGNLSHFIGKGNMEESRKMVSEVFMGAIEGTEDNSVKSFFFYHLNFFGKDEIVPLATKYLNDNQLAESAVAFLESCGTHTATHAMIDALPELSETNKVLSVMAIGKSGVSCALESVTGLLETTNTDLKKAVLGALAEIGDPSSYKAMMNAAKAAGYQYEPTKSAAALLRYAERLGKKGELEISEKICETLIKKCSGPGQQTYALSALSILVDQQGYLALEKLTKGINNPDKIYRAAVLRYAKQITDIAATREWMMVFDELTPAIQAELMTFFGNRGDLLVLPSVMKGLSSDSQELRIASMIAFGKLKGAEAVEPLMYVMAKASQEEVKVAKAVLNTIVGPDEMCAMAGGFDKLNKYGQIAIMELLASRQAKDYFELVRRNTSNEDGDIQAAAFSTLAKVSDLSNMRPLMSLLMSADEDYLKETQNAIVAAALLAESNHAKPVLDAYSVATTKHYRFIGMLPELGGQKALEAVVKAFNDGDEKMKNIAFEAFANWSDHSASSALFDICNAGGSAYQAKAFAGYVRQIKSAAIPADQKLLLLRKIMPLAANSDQRLAVVKALNKNNTFLSLIYLGKLMDDKMLANEAGRAVATIALPPSGSKEGMYGSIVREILEKAVEVISGEESDYIKANIKRWLEQMPKAEGYVSMFNGTDLTGWQGLVKNPIARSKMSEKELSAAQTKADTRLPEMWTVKNGEIWFTGSGYENLCSKRDYADFEMIVDWRINDKGDSGIYLRGTPQVQVWDTSRVESGAQVGSGGLYNNQKNPSKPLLVADNPINDWNTFYIRMIGERVTVYLNGKLVVDNVVLENYWDRSQPIFSSGPIELQAHGTDLAFRDVFVREINSEEYNLSVEEKVDGFVSLFNGKNLDGWIGNLTDYLVEDAVVVIRPMRGGHGNLYTEKEYADFNFRFEFQLTPGANNGLGIRTPPGGDAAYLGMELQILDNTAPIYANLQPYQYHGSVYGVIPAKRGFLKPVGEWNSEEVIIQGTRIKIILNGEVIVNGDIADGRDNGTMDHKNHPGLSNEKGHIGFLGHGSVVKFRNIRIKEL